MPFAAPLAARAIALALGASLAFAAGPPSPKPSPPTSEDRRAAAKPELVGSYGDWSVFHSQSGKNKVCYTLAQPNSATPTISSATPATPSSPSGRAKACATKCRSSWASTSARRAPTSSGDSKDKKKEKNKLVAPTAEVGDTSFDLLPKGANLWVKNAAQESALVAEMRKGKSLVVKATSKKGNLTTDTYSLAVSPRRSTAR